MLLRFCRDFASTGEASQVRDTGTMASALTSIYNGYNYLFTEAADPRTNNWFLIPSPWPAFILLVAYHNFVYKIGPSFMANRKPFNVDRLIQIYNIIQVVLCSWFVYEGFVHLYGPTGVYGLSCQPIDPTRSPSAMRIATMGWCYYMMKVLDLMDTVFFILRKKYSQVTFLHVYHHIGMVFLGWFGVKYLPGGQGVFLVFINSIVHAFMYAYYFISNYMPEYKKQIWWKKYLTQLQMIQFVLIFIQYGRVLVEKDCKYPHWPVYVFLPHNVIILYLFAMFYKKAYLTPKKESPENHQKKAA